MNTLGSYIYILHAMTSSPASLDKILPKELQGRLPCGCWTTPRSANEHRLRIRSFGSRNVALSFVGNGDFVLAKRALTDGLEPFFSSHYSLYEVVDTIMGPSTDWIGFLRTPEALIRGGKASDAWICPNCRQVKYILRGAPYILKTALPSSVIFTPTKGVLALHESIAVKILGCKWPGVDIEKIPVLTESRDGYPNDIDSLAPADERRNGKYIHRV